MNEICKSAGCIRGWEYYWSSMEVNLSFATWLNCSFSLHLIDLIWPTIPNHI